MSVARAVRVAVGRLIVVAAVRASAVSVTDAVVSRPVIFASASVTGVWPGKLATAAGGVAIGPVASVAYDSFGDAANAGETASALRAPASASMPTQVARLVIGLLRSLRPTSCGTPTGTGRVWAPGQAPGRAPGRAAWCLPRPDRADELGVAARLGPLALAAHDPAQCPPRGDVDHQHVERVREPEAERLGNGQVGWRRLR